MWWLFLNHIIFFSFSHCSALQILTLTSYRIRSLSHFVHGKEHTHNYRLQLFKYCEMWSLAGTKSACNDRPGYKDWENWELISEACPHLLIKTHNTVFIAFCWTSCSALLHCEIATHAENSTHMRPLLSPLYHQQSCKANMAIWGKHYLHTSCVE